MKTKTQDLIGPALDWAVELATGTFWSNNGYFVFKGVLDGSYYIPNPRASYSTDWSQAGPIIERERMELKFTSLRYGWTARWPAWIPYGEGETIPAGSGPTPLIAAMRCYVASKLGDEVEVPKELL